MSSAMEEIELLDRVLFRLGCADSDEKLESAVGKFLVPVLIKITSPHENVRTKVMEVLTHINKRLKSRSAVQIPVDAVLEQYGASDSAFLHNFSIIYITMGFPRLSVEMQTKLAPKLLVCLEGKPGNHQDKLLMLVLPLLGEIKIPDDPENRRNFLGLEDKPATRKQLISLLHDILLLPYGITQDAEIPPGFSSYSFKRIIGNNWRAEELEQLKKGIVRFICSDVFSDLETFILLVVASSDTRFSVATPTIAELSKVCTTLDFTDPHVTGPLYDLFSGNASKTQGQKTLPCSARVRQKLLQYLIKSRGKGINTPKGIQIIFECLFGENTNQKCKVLALQFCENLIKDDPQGILSKVSKVILSGLSKLVGKESTEPMDVQNAAYSAIAQLARSSPEVFNQDLKMVVSYFNHLSSAPPDLHGTIREALVSMAPAFAWNYGAMETDQPTEEKFVMSSQQNLLLAMLSDNAESKLLIIQNVTGVFLTTCFPEHFAPARYLLLLIAGDRSSLRETVTSYLYGVSKKDQINYNILSSIDHPEKVSDDSSKLSSEQRRVVLPRFSAMINYVSEMSNKRLSNSSQKAVVGKTVLPYSLNVYEEILDYLRICLWYSAGVRAAPGDEKYYGKLKQFILANYGNDESSDIYKYLQLVKTSVEARRNETNLMCLYDILNASPEIVTKHQIYLLEPLALTLKDVSETLRIHVAENYGILLAYGLEDEDFNKQISEILSSLSSKSLEHKHGWILVLGHAFARRFDRIKNENLKVNSANWQEFIQTVELLVRLICDQHALLVSAAVKGLSLIGRSTKLPEFPLSVTNVGGEEEMEVDEGTTSVKDFVFEKVLNLLKSSSVRAKIRQDAATCLGCLAIGDGEYFTERNLNKFLLIIKLVKDASLNIAIAQAIVSTINGFMVDIGMPDKELVNSNCSDETFEWFLSSLVKLVGEPNPHSRQSCSVWLLALVKHCGNRKILINKKQLLQMAFTELLSDDSAFVQDVASRGLGLVFSLSDASSKNDLANSLLDQLIGGKRQVNQVTGDTEIFPEGFLGKTPTGGNMTTYKELCSLASDLNQPEMIYQFMQLANHNATWSSKLGAAFGLQSISAEAKTNMKPYLGKIVPKLYRYKYDPTPKIQNSMISIWDSLVTDSKEVVETHYWDIMKEILTNLTVNEWRVRIACCLAVRDLLKRSSGLKLRSEEKNLKNEGDCAMVSDSDVPEPELKELWFQLFRVMDDIHEGTRLAAEGTTNTLSKICVTAASKDHGKVAGMAIASSILPLLLDKGVTHNVPEIRKISIKTISELIDSSGELIAPHLASLIPCLLKATGELETPQLSYLSTRVGDDSEAQEVVDTIRAETAKSNHNMEAISKCVRHLDLSVLEKCTPAVLDLMKTSVTLGSKIACAHFICLVSIKLGQEMTPLVGKYLGGCFVGLKDKNGIVRKYYASAIGHLVGIAKEQSVNNLFVKLAELYFEEPGNKSVPLTIQSINKRHHELLKDYMENILPLIFFAMHEEITLENKSNIELWKDLWIEISPGDAGIKLNLESIIQTLETNLDDPSWLRKAQSGNAINTIAKRLGSGLDEKNRLRLLNLLLPVVSGRIFKGKERILEAIASLSKGLNKEDAIGEQIINAVMKECRKEDIQYRIHALKAIGDILEELEADKFEQVYNMVWHILDKKDIQSITKEDNSSKDMNADERSSRAQMFNKLKETVCETIGKSWPKNSTATQQKYQIQFVERCSQCLRDCTRSVQISLLGALVKFLERLKVFEDDAEFNQEKKAKVEQNRDGIIEKICSEVLSAVFYVSSFPHTGLKKESLNIILVLINKLNNKENLKHLSRVKGLFEDNLAIYEKDSSPEVRCRIKDIENKLGKN